MRRLAAEEEVDPFIKIDKLFPDERHDQSQSEEQPERDAGYQSGKGRAARSDEYRDARDEFAAIRELRKKNWIAAHIRERR